LSGAKWVNRKEFKTISQKQVPDYSPVKSYIAVVAMVIIVTTIGKALQPAFDLINISLFYLLPVLISAVRWGRWPSLASSILGILAFDYFFIPPVLSFTVSDIRHLLNFAVFLIVALVTGTLAARLRTQAVEAKERDRRTALLYSLSRKIAVETDIRQVLQTVVDTVSSSVKGTGAVLIPGVPYNLLTAAVHSSNGEYSLEQKQAAMAQWAFEHGQQTSRGSDIPGAPKDVFIPITDGVRSLAVLALRFESGQVLSPGQQTDLEAFASLTALAMTRVRLTNEAEQAKWLLESEKLHKALLDAVSHDLRTPLSSITGAVTGLLYEEERYSEKAKTALLRAISEGAQRMNRFVTNLLDMTRIESGILKPNREWCDILDIIGVAAKEVRDILPENRIRIKTPQELPLVEVDFGLIEQVLINLLENAAKYSHPASAISISVDNHEHELVISILDKGQTIPEDEREQIFDKFYRLRSSKHVSGTGLGLSISKAMIDAHGGRLWVEPGPTEGNAFVFSLPIGRNQPLSVPAQLEEKDGG
jgi:two-component system, OmpR family, sensor histidine kinase KdpD